MRLAQLRSQLTAPTLPSLAEVPAPAGSWAALFAGVDTTAFRPDYTREHRDVLAPLIERVVPVRVAFGKYRVDFTWAPLGVALRQARAQVLSVAG